MSEIGPLDTLSVTAKLDDSGLSAVVKTRTTTAIDRLVGAVVDRAIVGLEAGNAKRRLQKTIELRVLEAEGDAALDKLRANPAFGDRLVARLGHEEIRRQENLEAVAVSAVTELLALPAPAPSEDPKVDEVDEVDEDWMNVFSRHAENASSDHLRNLWGRVLAGEIRQPKTFSLTTLRFISELDREIAEIFQSVVGKRFSSDCVRKPQELKGELLNQMTFLEEVGLLQDVNSTLTKGASIQPDGSVLVMGNRHFIRLTGLSAGFAAIKGIKITRLGRELATILPEPGDEPLRQFAEELKDKADVIEWCRFADPGKIKKVGDQLTYEVIEIIKDGVTKEQ